MSAPERDAPGSLWAGIPEASGRRRTRARALAYRLLAPLANGFSRAVLGTCRVRREGFDAWGPLVASGEPVLPCFWHDRLFVCIPELQRLAGLEPCYLVSPSIDGDLVELVLRRRGGHVVRGSATRTGPKAIRDLYKKVARERLSPVLLPDGPVGPRHEAKGGVLMLAQLTGAPILPLSFAASRSVRLGTWDELEIPLPFARVAIAAGAPRRVPRDADEARLEEERVGLEAALGELGSRCEDALGR